MSANNKLRIWADKFKGGCFGYAIDTDQIRVDAIRRLEALRQSMLPTSGTLENQSGGDAISSNGHGSVSEN